MTAPSCSTLDGRTGGATLNDPMLPAPFRIVHVAKENPDTFTMELEPASGNGGFRFLPGQFNMLYVHGVGEIPISISGDATRTDRIVHTTRAVGTVTQVMRRLRVGDTLGVRGPFGSAWPMERFPGKDVVVVTGGIGLAPLRPCIYELLRTRQADRKTVLLYGARTPEDMLYGTELRKWARARNLTTHVTVDRATGKWRGNVGVVTSLIPRAPFTPGETIALICGPEVMIRFTVLALQARGVARENIYVSMERNMKCAIGWCGHCQYGPEFVCKDGPVFPFQRIERLFPIREL